MRQKKNLSHAYLSVAILSYIADGLLAGLDQMAPTTSLSYESGHIQVLDPDISTNGMSCLEYTFPVGELPQQISSVEGVEAVTQGLPFPPY